MKAITVIIPTYNNVELLVNTVKSMAYNTVGWVAYAIVNNGSSELSKHLSISGNPFTPDRGSQVFNTGKNLGWAGGINYGIKVADPESKYYLFANDDIEILPGNFSWLTKMCNIMEQDEEVAAVAPSSNFVSGWQNIRHKGVPLLVEVKYLIGFCVLVRRSALEKIKELDYIDESLPGGDDLDWSIRFRDAGYKLIARRDVFVYHHGQVTGRAVHGDDWDSVRHREATMQALIKKHGFKKTIECYRNELKPYESLVIEYKEDNVLRRIVKGKGLDIGCGKNKEPEALGIDINTDSQADVISSGDDLPFPNSDFDYVISRHTVEHFLNPIKALREWNRVLKSGGYLGIITPDGSRWDSIDVDGDHKHQFDRSSVKDLLELTGFEVEELNCCQNQLDFYCIAKKKD